MAKDGKIWLSHTGLENLGRCPRCFWLSYRRGIRQPEGIVSRLANRFDTVLKNYFNMYRPQLPPMVEGKLEGRLQDPFQEKYFVPIDVRYGFWGKLDECLITAPTTGWDIYAVNVTDKWRSYVSDSGTIYVKLQDNQADANQTIIDIDFLGVRAKIDGTNFTFKNQGSMTSHLVSLWVINSTNHRRYDLDIFVNSAETFSYIRADISLPSGQYFVKVIMERGNTAVYAAG